MDADASGLIKAIRVSSTLNNDAKQYGKKYLMDGKDDTCWNSDEGERQWISIEFKEAQQLSLQSIRGIQIQFQGGFSSKQLDVRCVHRDQASDTTQEVHKETFFPEDTNKMQSFNFNGISQLDDESASKCYNNMTLAFTKPTDLFGRIIVYHLKLLS